MRPAGFFTADGEGTIDYLNATLAQWLGLDLADVAERPAQARQDHVGRRRGADRQSRPRRRARRHAALRYRPRQGRRHHASGAHPALPAALWRQWRACARAGAQSRPWRRGRGRRRRAQICAPVQLGAHRHRHRRPRRHHQHHQRRLRAAVRPRRRWRAGAQGDAGRALPTPMAPRPCARRSTRPSPGKA